MGTCAAQNIHHKQSQGSFWGIFGTCWDLGRVQLLNAQKVVFFLLQIICLMILFPRIHASTVASALY